MSTPPTPGHPLRARLEGLLPLLALLMAVLALSTHIRLRIMLGDEGVTCVNAWRLAMGQLPGRDFFEVIPPFSFWVLSLLFRVLGPTMVASRILAFAYGLSLLGLLFVLGRRLLLPPAARALLLAFMIPFGVCAWPIPSHHWLVDILQLGALVAWLKAFERNPVLWSLCAGALSGLALMTVQDQGLYWIAAASLLVLPVAPRHSRKALLLGWLGGVTIILVASAAWLLPGNSLSLLVHDWCLMPLTHYAPSQGTLLQTGAGWGEVARSVRDGILAQHPVFAPLVILSYGLVFALPVLAGLSAVALWRNRSLDRRQIMLLIAAALAFVAGAMHRWTIMNLIWAAPGPLLLVAVNAGSRWESASKWRRGGARGFCGAALVLCLLFGLVRSFQLLREPAYLVSTDAGNLTTLSGSERDAVQDYVDAIDHLVPKGAPAFIHGYVPLIGFLTRHANPTRLTVLLTATGYNSPDQGQEWIAALESGNIQWGFGPRWALAPEDSTGRYLAERFEPAWQNSSFILWRRRPASETPADGRQDHHG